MQTSWRCALAWGLFVSLGIGTLVTLAFHLTMYWLAESYLKRVEVPAPEGALATTFAVSSVLTGIMERAVFTLLVVAQPTSALTAMGGWMAIKLAHGWQKANPGGIGHLRWTTYGSIGLQTSFLSLAFAALGGGITRLMMGLDLIAGWPPAH